jgi:hypothetical protein
LIIIRSNVCILRSCRIDFIVIIILILNLSISSNGHHRLWVPFAFPSEVSFWHAQVQHQSFLWPLYCRLGHLYNLIRLTCINRTLLWNTPHLSFGLLTIHSGDSQPWDLVNSVAFLQITKIVSMEDNFYFLFTKLKFSKGRRKSFDLNSTTSHIIFISYQIP